MTRIAGGRMGAAAAVWLAWAALAFAGCTADPLGVRDGAVGDSGRQDGAGGDAAGDDVGPDGRVPSDGGEPDMADMADVGAGGAGGLDLAVDEGFDMAIDEGVGGGEVVEPPPFEQVAVTRRGSDTFFVWVDADGQVVSAEVDDDARIVDGPRVVAIPEVRPERVAALEVDGYPWVAFGAADAPVALFQVDLPEETRVELDGLFGPPLLAAASDGVLVIARTAEGALAWQRVSNELEVEPRVVDDFELDMPDDATAVSAGVVLFFSDAGQCLQIRDADWQAAGTFVCPGGNQSRLISDGQRALVSRIYAFGVDQNIGVTGLYEDTGDYRISFFELSSGTAFSNDGDERPVVGGRVIDQARRLVASVVGPRSTWDSVQSWTDTSEWPFDRVRAMARRTLPDRARTGRCAVGGARCSVADDCDEGACEGAAGSEYLVALGFRGDGRPRIQTFELRQRFLNQPAYDIEFDPGCIPVPEVCDGLDQDCDGSRDDGRCCAGDRISDVDYRWETDRPIATVVEDGRQRYAFVAGDVERNDAYRVMFRYADTYQWQGRTFGMRQFDDAPGDLRLTFNDAVDARFLLAAGGVTAMVARQYVEGGEGDWAVFMGHPDRTPEQGPPRAVAPLPGCSEVLAADTLNHRSIAANPAGEQFLVVCPEKIVRVYAVVGGLGNVEYLAEQFDIPEIGWATINRGGVAELDILLGYEVADEGAWAVRALTIEGDQPGEPEQGFLPLQLTLQRLRPNDAADPIHLHPVATRAPIQIRDSGQARLAFNQVEANGSARTEWRNVLLAPDPIRTVFSPASFRIFSTGEVPPAGDAETATAWWATDVTANNGLYNLWSTEPVFRVDAPVAYWYAAQGSYGNDLDNVDVSAYDVLIVSPTDDSGTNWRLVTRETDCTEL